MVFELQTLPSGHPSEMDGAKMERIGIERSYCADSF